MLTTAQVAKRANIAHNTVRNYAKEYSELVSPDARGENGERRFSDEDAETICTIAALRKSGVPPSEVVERIRNQEVPPVVDVDVTLPQNTLQEPSEIPQNAPEASYALQVVSNTLQARLEAIERQIADQRVQQHDRWTIICLSFIAGMVAALVLFGVAYLLLTVGR
jgi:DNA-binding transcriptional MerR regulator